MSQPTVILPARQGEHRYQVHVGEDALGPLAELARAHDRVAVVTCARVARTPVARRALAALKQAGGPAVVVTLPDGERGKTLAQLERAATRLLTAGLTRRSLVVSIGGGAVSDVAGFLAATFMRGLPWVAVPTTLLAMVDAALGGKTAVNLPRAKNAVGAFHPPAAVLADPRALDTLPRRELRSGLGEVVKYGLLEPALLGRITAGGRGASRRPAGGRVHGGQAAGGRGRSGRARASGRSSTSATPSATASRRPGASSVTRTVKRWRSGWSSPSGWRRCWAGSGRWRWPRPRRRWRAPGCPRGCRSARRAGPRR